MSRDWASIFRVKRAASALALGLCIVTTAAGVAHAGSVPSASSKGCGGIEITARSWLGGHGVHVRSNGIDEGTDASCSAGLSRVDGVVAGLKWQCVELVNRLYLANGWISTEWYGDAGVQFWQSAPPRLTKEANGHVSYLGPGDVVDVVERYQGRLVGGHVFVVDASGQVRSGVVGLVSQNNSGVPDKPGSISHGRITVSGATGGWTYRVIGVIHAP